MSVRLFFTFCLVIAFAQVIQAQNIIQTNPLPPIRTCGTMEQDSINRLRFPERGTLEEFEQALQKKILEINARKNAGSRTQGTILSIPIIVHVVHNGEVVGSGLNLSQTQIQAQIDVLNEDYRRKSGTPGFNSSPVGADLEIEFCLSPVDENGQLLAEPGIDRYNGGKQSWTRQEIDGSLKPTTIWNPNLFYNIWTLKFGGEDASLLGYAQFPDQSGLAGLNETGGPATTDGVVVQYTSFGSVDKGNFPIMQSPYNRGRTLSHETGHFFGLRHIWGDGPCADDFVSDTPAADGPNRGCPVGRVSCGGVNMPQNYMDYSDDACMNIFTNGQKTRVIAVTELSPRRKTLFLANLCSPVVADVPTAKFDADKQSVLLGGEVNFIDLSTNFPTQWNWTFEGGNPNTSNLRNPKVRYNTSGSYKVSLTSTNPVGTSALFEVLNYITVSNEGLCSELINFKSSYTPSLLKLSAFGNYSGYLAGHNSLQAKGFSEFFLNSQGYKYISAVKIGFGYSYTTHEDATVTVTVWNARGPQNGPGSVIERKTVLLKQIKEDIDHNRPTAVIFDRETPVFGRAFQVGIEINYDQGDSLAITSSANGENTNATSWIEKSTGLWSPYAIYLGANIALDITPVVGVNPSVQVSASKLLISAGEEVILNARGASIFVWTSDDGSIQNYAGPQLIVHPAQTTIYTISGSGLELCNNSATATIYTSSTITGVAETSSGDFIRIYPNPGNSALTINMQNNFNGPLEIQFHNTMGQPVGQPIREIKSENEWNLSIETAQLLPGVYLLNFSYGGRKVTRKWIKI